MNLEKKIRPNDNMFRTLQQVCTKPPKKSKNQPTFLILSPLVEKSPLPVPPTVVGTEKKQHENHWFKKIKR